MRGDICGGGVRKAASRLQRDRSLRHGLGCHSIGFPLISAGIYGYPKDKARERAIRACRDFFEQNPDVDMQVVFAVLDDHILMIGRQALDEIAPEYKEG